MKKVTKFFMAALLAGMCSLGYAQTKPDYMNKQKPNERYVGTISMDVWSSISQWTENDCYLELLEKAQIEYPTYNVDIREMKCTFKSEYQLVSTDPDYGDHGYGYVYGAHISGTVVRVIDPQVQTHESLSQALNKALRNVQEGSRLAIDQVTVTSNMDRGEFKDQLIDILLDKGYKVVAKEYLAKLYEEQQAQQSGIYNERTTVQENNFSAVGYYINVKVTETSLRVQVVNVSTGEYEGNATVNF